MKQHGRLWWKLRHLRNGFRYGYPFCCVLRFTFSWQHPQALRRGIRRTVRGGTYVPCCVFHRPTEQLDPRWL